MLRILALILLSAAVNSCAMPFYWQAISGEMELLRKREPIDEVLANPHESARVKAVLSSVKGIKAFAVHELGLPDNKSYTTYADLGREYVVWNVVATPEFSIVPKHWCFPFAGCVSYRGFFAEDHARRFAQAMKKQGYDTYLGGSTAYSTLGHLKDPILNTMVDEGEQYLASVLFHELAHQRLYVKNDSAFDEAFAMTIEEYGTQKWLAAQGDTKGLAQYRLRLRRRAEFAELVQRQQQRLQNLFARPISAQAKREAKAEAYAQMRSEYERLRKSLARTALTTTPGSRSRSTMRRLPPLPPIGGGCRRSRRSWISVACTASMRDGARLAHFDDDAAPARARVVGRQVVARARSRRSAGRDRNVRAGRVAAPRPGARGAAGAVRKAVAAAPCARCAAADTSAPRSPASSGGCRARQGRSPCTRTRRRAT